MKPTRISPVFRELELKLSAHMSDRRRSERLAAFALEKITEAKVANGRNGEPARHRQIVDGREGAALISVKPDGVIVARFDLLHEVLDWIGNALIQESPVLSGKYAKSHVLYVDGEPYAGGGPIPTGELYTFVNIQPYARKIDRGFSDKAPEGVYEAVAGVANKKFGNVAKVTFGWHPLIGAAPLEAWAAKTSLKPAHRKLKQASLDEWRKRQPTIFVRPF